MEIKGKTVLITGGALRIGQALVKAFAAAGARVIIHYRQSGIDAEELRRSLPSPDSHQTIQADLANPDDAATLMSRCQCHIDILINNAAMFVTSPLKDENPIAFQTQMQVNFFSPLKLMQEFQAQPAASGCIINLLDQQVIRQSDNSGSYFLSKKSLADATLLAARQFAPAVRVNAIAPGPVLPPSYLPPGAGMKKVLEHVPLGRQVNMDDLVAACLFLCRNESITGQILFVDGGQHLT